MARHGRERERGEKGKGGKGREGKGRKGGGKEKGRGWDAQWIRIAAGHWTGWDRGIGVWREVRVVRVVGVEVVVRAVRRPLVVVAVVVVV